MSAATSAADVILRRRPPAFFKGKVLRLSAQTAPEGHPPGYYLLVDITEGNMWHYQYLGSQHLLGPAIYDYHTPGQLDLWAVPDTVFPREAFWGWGIVTVLLIAGLTVGGHYGPDGSGDMFVFAMCMFIPMWVGLVGLKWLENIEPVFATKVLFIWIAIQVLWSARSERTQAQVVADQKTRMLS